MGGPAKLLEWQYMIFLLHCFIAAFLLLLSSLRLGHRGGHHGVHGHAVVHGHSGAPAAHTAHSAGAGAAHGHGHATHAQGPSDHATGHDSQAHPAPHAHHHPTLRARIGKVEVSRDGPNKENITISTNFVLHIIGADRAPLLMILEAFCLVWGIAGYWANQFLLHADNPTFAQMAPSLAIAFGGGVIGARMAAEIIVRAMPQDETQIVSREGLFGLTGKIAFPVSATTGRIHIYDEHGTLHDELCRVAPDHPTIEKGHRALVVDMDAQGHLIVEEVPDSVR